MKDFFVDLHIHIGNARNKPIKITASKSLTFFNILEECINRKGMQIIGIIDCGSTFVQEEIEELIEKGMLIQLSEGGLKYKDLVIILGSEVETTEVNGGDAHCLCYFPNLTLIRAFTSRMKNYIKNINLSSQKGRLTLNQLINIVNEYDGEVIPAHIFTPHKGIYGNCTDRLGKLIDIYAFNKIAAVELGLSADSDLADCIAELSDKSFVTNSDAHSLSKIGREYNIIRMKESSFKELFLALRRIDGRGVIANFGLEPKLGKYHRTHCLVCDEITTESPPIKKCTVCDRDKIVLGVLDRIVDIADFENPKHPKHRPPYNYQIPLQFLPKVGPKTISKLIDRFGSEMEVIHRVQDSELRDIVGEEIGNMIIKARNGLASVEVGGGGRYGRILKGDE